MVDYDFAACLSPLDFELLSKDLLEAELEIRLENFSEGRDKGIDLRYAPILDKGRSVFNLANFAVDRNPPELIVQCKRYSEYSDLKSVLKNRELAKIKVLKPARYILTTSVSLSPQQSTDVKEILSPYVQSTDDIYGRERLNSLLAKHAEVERRHTKLWVASAGVLDSILNAGTHFVSNEEVERTLTAAKIYVQNVSFDDALEILKKDRVCIISGIPGIGKTTLARMLMLYFYGRQFDVVKITSDISEAHAVVYNNKPRFYYYDDFLGQTAQADKLNKNEDQRLLDFMASVRNSKDSVFVLTTREYILNQAKLNYEKLDREKFDHRTCIIDLSKYSRRIRAEILYNHLHFSQLPKSHLDALVARRGYIDLVDHRNYNPRLIEYLTNSAWIGEVAPEDYLKLFLRKLDNPVEIWEHAFRNQLSIGARHLLFVLTTMPTECLIEDVETAFVSFHSSYCVQYKIPYSAMDFRNAMKELDGTFISIRKVEQCLLIRFQNPSIRDFMQFLLLGGELLEETLASLVYFEQALWLIEIMEEKALQTTLRQLLPFAPQIVAVLQRLVDSNSCTISIDGHQRRLRVSVKPSNPFARIAAIVSAMSKYNVRIDNDWATDCIAVLETRLISGNHHASSVVGSLDALKSNGLLNSDAGKQFVRTLKNRAMSDPSDIDDYEALANVVKALRDAFDVAEVELISEAYSEFASSYSSECDLSDPDELRDEASRLGLVGDLLQVDTDEAQDMMRELAGKIEMNGWSDWYDDEDDHRGSRLNQDECSDGELDSMFGTLNG